MTAAALLSHPALAAEPSRGAGCMPPDADGLVTLDVVPDSLPAIAAAGITVTGDLGRRNRIVVHRSSRLVKLAVAFHGHGDNLLVVGQMYHLQGRIEFEGSRNVFVTAGSNKFQVFTVTFRRELSACLLGRNVISNGTTCLIEGPGRRVVLGEGAMMSWGVRLETSDRHAIFAIDDDPRQLNPPADITVEPAVWVGQDALILKGVSIGRGAIIGARSVVTRDVPAYCSAAGVPCRVLRRNVSWLYEAQPDQAALRHAVEAIRG